VDDGKEFPNDRSIPRELSGYFLAAGDLALRVDITHLQLRDSVGIAPTSLP